MTKTAIPTSPDELQSFLADSTKVGASIQDGSFPDVIKAYAKGLADKDHSIAEQVQEQVQVGLQDFLKDNRAELVNKQRGPSLGPDTRSATPQAIKQGLYNKAATGAAADGVFDNAAEFFRAISPHARNYRDGSALLAKRDKLQDIQNSFGTNVPSDGGFLVPEQYRSDLLQLALESSLIRPMATVIPMSSQRLSIPFVDSTSNATTVLGGWQAYWVDEATQATETQAKFGAVTLDAKKLMLYSSAPNELVADGVGFEAFLRQSLPKVLAFEEDYRFMQGTGVGEPLGFVSCAAAVTATAVSGQGASTIIKENIDAMYARMLPSSLSSAIWVADIGLFPQLASMAQNVGTGGSPVWLTNGGVIGAPPVTIYGRPVYFTEKLPALGTTGDIMFIDPSYYLVGDRQQVQVTSSTDYLFNVDKTAYKVIERVDGRPWIQSAITPKNGGSTLSPFVQLSGTRT